jgi:tRNA U34 5-methylaminomethyl-2-thiouridine-forming methyltransferase MnmC
MQIIKTKDGSHTLINKDISETFHSVNGAITESVHVFINAGFKQIKKTNLKILEIGFGTGLNMLLTFLQAKTDQKKVYYETVEKYPITKELYTQLNYTEQLNCPKAFLNQIHSSTWDIVNDLADSFSYKKVASDFIKYDTNIRFDVIYFDAFAPDKQPELWTKYIFEKCSSLLNNKGLLTTYSAKGEVKRNLIKAGFEVDKLQGPPGKRHILRAFKR